MGTAALRPAPELCRWRDSAGSIVSHEVADNKTVVRACVELRASRKHAWDFSDRSAYPCGCGSSGPGSERGGGRLRPAPAVGTVVERGAVGSITDSRLGSLPIS